MKFGIKTGRSEKNWLYNLNEYEGAARAPLKFSSVSEAEEYAQDHEIPNYEIEPLTEEKKQLNG